MKQKSNLQLLLIQQFGPRLGILVSSFVCQSVYGRCYTERGRAIIINNNLEVI